MISLHSRSSRNKRSFTRAATKLGMSQSALSHAMKSLEERLGARLPVADNALGFVTTETGESAVARSLRPALDEITAGVNAVGALRGKPSGTLRITATKHAVSVGCHACPAEVPRFPSGYSRSRPSSMTT